MKKINFHHKRIWGSNFSIKGCGMSASVPARNITGTINVKSVTKCIVGVFSFAGVSMGIYYLAKGCRHLVAAYNCCKNSATGKKSDKHPETTLPKSTPMNEILTDDSVDEENEVLGPTFIVKGSRNVIYGPKKSRKSSIALTIAKSVATGMDYGMSVGLDCKMTSPIHVDFVDGEMRPKDHKRRYHGVDFSNVTIKHDFKFPSYKEFCGYLKDRVLSYGKDILVIVDNATKVFGDLTAEEMNDFDSRLKAIGKAAESKGYSFTFIMLMHTGKDEKAGPRGTSNIGNFYENIFRLEKIDSKYSKLIFEDCRDYPDGVEYVFNFLENSFLATFDPEKTKQMCGQPKKDVEPEVQYYKDLTADQIQEMADYHNVDPANRGYGTLFKVFGKRFGFGSESTLRRAINMYVNENPSINWTRYGE